MKVRHHSECLQHSHLVFASKETCNRGICYTAFYAKLRVPVGNAGLKYGGEKWKKACAITFLNFTCTHKDK